MSRPTNSGSERIAALATADEHKRRRYESPDMGRAIERQVYALVTRCLEGDTEALEELARVHTVVNRAILAGARGLYARDYTWADIGGLLGISRQAASQRFRDS